MQETVSPAEIYQLQLASACKKHDAKRLDVFVLGILGGFFIALGSFGSALASFYLAGSDPGLAKFVAGSIFPVGLMFCVLAGGELYTGNCITGLAPLEKRGQWTGVLSNLLAVFLGNYVGAILFTLALYASGMYTSQNPRFIEVTIATAEAKVGLSFGAAVIRGYLCNLVVVGAIWLQAAAKDVSGRILAMWFAIMVFVVSGFEHVVANMYYLTAGLFLGADFSIPEMLWRNILPVSLGNALSGVFGLPFAYYYLYGRKKA